MNTACFRESYGEWAVITGASDGIGREFARELAARGLNVLLVARRGGLLDALAAALHAAHGVQCRTLVADLATPSGRQGVFDASADLDVGLLVAAAGYGTSGPLIASAIVDEENMLSVNCSAVLGQCAHFGRRFASRGRGGLVLMSSLLAFQGTPRAANYAATKAYIQTLAEGLRKELAPSGVSVVASAPGPIASGFAARADMRMSNVPGPRVVATQTLAALGRRVTIRPGGLSKLLGWSLAPLPRALRVTIMGRVMAAMTAHQHSDAAVPQRTAP